LLSKRYTYTNGLIRGNWLRCLGNILDDSHAEIEWLFFKLAALTYRSLHGEHTIEMSNYIILLNSVKHKKLYVYIQFLKNIHSVQSIKQSWSLGHDVLMTSRHYVNSFGTIVVALPEGYDDVYYQESVHHDDAH